SDEAKEMLTNRQGITGDTLAVGQHLFSFNCYIYAMCNLSITSQVRRYLVLELSVDAPGRLSMEVQPVHPSAALTTQPNLSTRFPDGTQLSQANCQQFSHASRLSNTP